MTAPADWTAHRRDDGELLGWVRPHGELWVPVDLLGRDAAGASEWLAAEAVLEARGLGWLSGVWLLETEDGTPLRVRLAEVGTDGVAVDTDGLGAIDATVLRIRLPWPAPAALRPPRPGEPLPPPALMGS